MKALLVGLLLAPIVASAADQQRYDQLIQGLSAQQPVGARMVQVGKKLLGSPYQVAPLEQGDEKLQCGLSAFDCVTLVESTLAVSRSLGQGFIGFTQEMERIRYRGGRLMGYASRLHYFTDWIHDNAQKGIVRDLTQSLGGVPDTRRINFMTTHRSSYKALSDQQSFELLQKAEEALNARPRFVLPKEFVAGIESQLQDGDILAFATSIPGLDVSHTGLVIRQQGRAHVLHAPLQGGKVLISQDPLPDYLSRQSKMTGILVARPR